MLFVIDDRDFAAKVAQAEAAVATAEATVATYDSRLELQQAMIDQAEAAVTAAEADLDRAQRDYQRYTRADDERLRQPAALRDGRSRRAQGRGGARQERAPRSPPSSNQLAVLRSQQREEEARLAAGPRQSAPGAGTISTTR